MNRDKIQMQPVGSKDGQAPQTENRIKRIDPVLDAADNQEVADMSSDECDIDEHNEDESGDSNTNCVARNLAKSSSFGGMGSQSDINASANQPSMQTNTTAPEQRTLTKPKQIVPPIALGANLADLRSSNKPEHEQEEVLLDPPSQRDRRRRHHEVANEAEEQLRKLAEITKLQKDIEDLATPRDTSESQLSIENISEPVVAQQQKSPTQYDLAQRMNTLQEDSEEEDSCEHYDVDNNIINQTMYEQSKIKFEIYDDVEEIIAAAQTASQNPQTTKVNGSQQSKPRSGGDQSSSSGIFDYLAEKKQSFTSNINGFFEKLDKVEQRLKESQDRIDLQADEEEKKKVVKAHIEKQLAKTIYQLNEESGAVDREGLSRSSKNTATTRDSDSDPEHSSEETKQEKVRKMKQMCQVYDQISSSDSPVKSEQVSQIMQQIDSENKTSLAEFTTNTPVTTQWRTSSIKTIGKKKKYAKRVVPKPNTKKQQSAQKKNEDRDDEVFKKAFSEIQNGVIDVFSSAKFF